MSLGRKTNAGKGYKRGGFGRGGRGSSTVRADGVNKMFSSISKGAEQVAQNAVAKATYQPHFKMSFDEGINSIPFASAKQGIVVLSGDVEPAVLGVYAQETASAMLQAAVDEVQRQMGGLAK